MRRWTVRDRRGHEIYITEERWKHILELHDELSDLFDDVLDTIRKGRRRQDPHDPQTYKYYRRCERLPLPYTHIIVAVAFRFRVLPDGSMQPNNFVTSAWGVHVYRER